MEETEATKAVEEKQSGSTRSLAISVWCLAQAIWAVVKNYTTQSLIDPCIQVGTQDQHFKKCTTEYNAELGNVLTYTHERSGKGELTLCKSR